MHNASMLFSQHCVSFVCLYMCQGQAMTHVHNGEMLQVTQTGNGVNE